MKKFDFTAKIEGVITVDNDMSMDDVVAELRHALFCVVEDGNSPEYLSIGLNLTSVKVKKREI